jgi:ABC-2 type transport system permease protein
MRILTFSRRCAKEILRDPVNLAFGLGFPLVLLLLLSIIQSNIPVELFAIESLAPGVAVFGLSFMTLFSATLVAKDRESAFLERLYTTPMRSHEFILGYMLPVIPISVGQSVVCYIVALFLGLPISANILIAILVTVPISVIYISLGLLVGSLCGVKAVGGICGGLFTNLSAWLSGVWFDLSLVGGAFERAAGLLPFVHAVELGRAIISGSCSGVLVHFAVVVGYAIATTVLAIVAFLGQMKKQ